MNFDLTIRRRAGAIFAAVLACAGPAAAGELPTLARGPVPETAAPASIWQGLSVGVEGIVVGGRGMKTGFGGATTVAWSRRFENDLILGLKASAGHLPAFAWTAWPGRRLVGVNFVTTEASLAYDFGRVRPWAAVGAGFVKPTAFGGARGLDAVNSFFDEPGRTRGVVTYGAGVDFAVSNRLTIGVGVRGMAQQ
ncbi:MAG: hypothetical protein JNK46_02470 [Methylobacteriaceae bacterium]|nr:hypothetical protein [Methylobacteriaceae bacterium]